MKRTFLTATGTFTAYGHSVVIEVLGLEFDAVVFFAANNNIRRNVLGQQGWLNRVRLAIVDYDGELYLNRYEDE